jgi:hypothetical protein
MGGEALWAKKLQEAAAVIAKKHGGDVYTGDGATNNISGFNTALASETGAYAGQNRALGVLQAESIRPKVFDAGSPGAPALDQIRADLTAIEVRCGVRPDLAPVAPALYDRIAKLFDANRNYVDKVLEGPDGKAITHLRHGADIIDVDGCKIFRDVNCPSDRMFYLNTEHLSLVVAGRGKHPGIPGWDMQANDGVGPMPFGVMFEVLAKTGDADKVQALIECQLKVESPKHMGCRLNLSATA